MTIARDAFHIFKQEPNSCYFDHASTSQTPDVVLDVMQDYYKSFRANVHRGVYGWSAKSSQAYEDARSVVADFIGATCEELVFTSGATESINLVASAYASHHLKNQQVILVSALEHHANLIPWQEVAKTRGCVVKLIPHTDTYQIDWQGLQEILNEDVALIALTHASNVLGIKHDIAKVVNLAKGIPVLVDGTQVVSHEPIDVKSLGCAFYAFSSHKMYGPTGMGALYIHEDYLDQFRPYMTGGGMIDGDFMSMLLTSKASTS